MDGSIDSAFWFPAGEGGVVSIVGWALAAERSEPVLVEIRVGDRIFERLSPIEARPDVGTVHPGAPIECGFEFVLPSPANQPVEVTLYTENGDAGRFACTPRAADDPQLVAAELGIGQGGVAKLANLLRNEGERLSRAVVKESRPISLYLDPAFACNLDCPHCVSKFLRDHGVARTLMKGDLFDTIISNYGRELIRVTLALWGEPLLNRQTASFVRRLKALDIFVETSTNLSVPMTDAQIDEVMEAGFDEIRLSIDGATQSVYEKYRVGGSLDLVLNNLRRMVAFKRRSGGTGPLLKWQFLLWPWNEHEVAAARELSQTIGADQFYVLRGDPWTDPGEPRQRNEEDDDRPMDAELAERIREKSEFRKRHRHHVGCDFLDHTLAINSDGVILPCCYVAEPHSALGRIKAGEWQDHFNSAGILAARKFVADPAGSGTGPVPCVACPSLATAHIRDHLDFYRAIAILRSRFPQER